MKRGLVGVLFLRRRGGTLKWLFLDIAGCSRTGPGRSATLGQYICVSFFSVADTYFMSCMVLVLIWLTRSIIY